MIRQFARKIIPPIGETERIALECGTVSLDGRLFEGKLSKRDIAGYWMTEEEEQFVEVVVPNIVKRYNEMGMDAAISYMKLMGVFGLNIPREYGGLGFRPAAISEVMTALASSGHAALTVIAMVPNSLGPAELILHHGTEEEKKSLLPALAKGKKIPCFALTGVKNGSDATSNMDRGIIVGDTIHVDLDKRYCTLAPIADVIALAVDVEEHGITLFLIDKDHPGLEIGMAHDPLGLEFPNGPIRGTVVLDMDKDVLGGKENLGRGWQMLVECLSVGRAVSLPAMAVGTCRMAMAGIGAYTRARRQFGVPINKFEAIQEKLADIRYHTTILEAAQAVVNAELNRNEQPAVLGAMLKYQATERCRIVVNHAMDIAGGVGIQEGPNNWLAESYRGLPIGITVEGANVMTRSLITYSQGLVRSHPHVRGIIDGLYANSFLGFYRSLFGLVWHSYRNGGLSLVGKLPALFALTANFTLLLGGRLKRSEYITGRMADFFSNVFFHTVVKDEFVKKRLLQETKETFYEIYNELPLIARMKLWLPAKICFFLARKPRFSEISEFVEGYHEDAKTKRVVTHEGSRLWQLQQILHGSTDYINEVIQVDDTDEDKDTVAR